MSASSCFTTTGSTDFNFGSFDVEAGLRYIVPQWHNLLLRLELQIITG